MKVGMLVIGSEILEGKILDTNTRTLSEFLKSVNADLELALTVRDRESDIHQALKILLEKCDVVVTSGGIGPTKDDLTKSTIASFLGRKIQYSSAAQAVAEQNYTRMGRPFPGKDHVYSFLPEGFLALNNSTGFAPSLFTQHMDKFILSGAGVPREFKALLEEHFGTLVGKNFKQGTFKENFTVRTKKVPEEKIFGEVDPTLWDKLATFGEVSSLPKLLGVDIGVKLEANSQSDLDAKKQKVRSILQASPVSKIIWHEGTKEVEEFIIELATKKGITFGFAESCTGGLCSHRITSVSGSSKCLKGSVVSYTNEVKEKILGVKHETLTKFSDVSEETAKEMAQGLLKSLGVDIAISITGIAGPTGGSVEKPVGTFCIGVATQNGPSARAERMHYLGDRELLKNRFSQAALFTLLEELEKIAHN